ncbi:5,10-methylene-tetrahydrofolate dehydrogenase [Staphylococcus pseudoxylosus]|uniref:5,10-methylene-tetrahydrofolate dehydrogenase n=1 Tax=Staphylococcus pseudoxylosus TaxID=2282419 RepID=UPI00298FBB1B|nr:5,10-methylene-tetrahydrofolate dehydrogenase [Staphylococcus pseudoxylosus]MDW8797860.1 5,10-methylene-tetrahydrofolate dehydrogenase [Staphylococcus pseudoxylosus]MEB6044000.1 5,10-methylene-tetrahydrofolate dehydrogenase [Staphylococcus pseudoxylosus]MEB8009579.1 5,10-methylene-tetrahydrofolate dehydrogenase [Staphylococcus pseudoxylosus]MEB8086331.1 5,10-methylene-tetrahydrofolate dehydrogenase [Staphylococcus pseudoxylosus]
MCSNIVKIGLVAAPGVTEKIACLLKTELPELLASHFSENHEWQIETIIDPLTGSAETVQKIFRKISDYQNNNEWQYTIGLTDLPIVRNGNAVAFDINSSNGASLISIPSYGWRPIKKRLQRSILGIIDAIDEYNESNMKQAEGEDESEQQLNAQFPFSNLVTKTEYFEDTDSKHTLYYVSSNTKGSFRLISGMTFANNPFNMLKSLSNVVAIAFTTGAFGIVFTTMWNLSFVYSVWRMLLIMLVAILGMMVWIIVAHNLWESSKESNNKQITMLYNLTTTLTLTVSIVFYYLILFCLFLLASLVVLPPGYLGQTLQLNGPANFITYINLAWFATSISTVAGAIGAGLNNESQILESTYGYRQKQRYKKMDEDEKERAEREEDAQYAIKAKKQESEAKAKQYKDSD